MTVKTVCLHVNVFFTVFIELFTAGIAITQGPKSGFSLLAANL